MRRWVPTLAMLIVTAIATALGFWQLDRAAQKITLQAELDRVGSDAPVRLATDLVEAEALDGRAAIATGTFDASRTVFLDNRTHDGVAGFHVFTPMRISRDGEPARYVIVLRGFVPRNIRDRAALPELPDLPGLVEVSGQAVANLQQTLMLGEDVPPTAGQRLWQRFSIDRFGQWSGLSVQPVVIRQSNDTGDGLIRDWPQPGLKIDTHYGYAVQWFGIALSAVAFWAWALFFRGRSRA